MVKASLDKLDMKKLLNDIQKYGKCGVPSEKLNFWNTQLEESLKELTTSSDSEVSTSESTPLEQLLGKEKYSSTTIVREIPSAIIDVVDKDRAPLPEVLYLPY